MHPDDNPSIPDGICQCGCGGKTRIRTNNNTKHQWRKGEYARYIRFHSKHTANQRYEIEDRGYTTPCHIWQGFIEPVGGYGLKGLRINGKNTSIKAHRWYYEKAKGPIPKGLILDHLCRVRACVNPDHLEPVTYRVNNERGDNTKLTLEDARAIRAIGRSMKQKDIAAIYGINQSTVSAILLNKHKYWREE